MAQTTRGTLAILLAVLATGCTLTGEAVAERQPFVLGAIQPLSRSTVGTGEQVQQGIDLAVADINAHGGIDGRPLRVVYEDDQCDANEALAAFERLTAAGDIRLIIGPTCSSVVLAVAPRANERKVILLTTVASTDRITAAGDYIFRNTPSGREYSYAVADFAYHRLGARSAASLYLDLDNGIDFKDSFRERFTGLGGRMLVEEAYASDGTDFRTQLLKIKEAGPDVIFLAGQINQGLAVKQARELGIETQFIGPVAVETPEFLTAAGPAAEGIVYAAPAFDPEDARTAAFSDTYRQAYGNRTLGFRTPIAYDAVMLLAAQLERCGDDTECIKTGLYATRGYAGISGVTSFDENGDVIKPLMLKTVRNGRFVRYDE